MSELQPQQGHALTNPDHAVAAVTNKFEVLDAVRKAVLKRDVHFGEIPGTQKPTLLKPGAEALCAAFGLSSETASTDTRYLDGGHIDVIVAVSVRHAASGIVWATGTGSCSTLESKFRYRNAQKLCPCGKELRRDRDGRGYYCWVKVGGCGATWSNESPQIVNQPTGKIENPDIADQYNTVRKMAWKRAYLAAVLTATCSSQHFTQDVDDQDERTEPPKSEPPPRQPAPQQPAQQEPREEYPVRGTPAPDARVGKPPSLLKQLIALYTGEEPGGYLDYAKELWASDRGEPMPTHFKNLSPDDLGYIYHAMKFGPGGEKS